MSLLISGGITSLVFFYLLSALSCGAAAPNKHYYDGVQFATEGRLEQARDEFIAALKQDPMHYAYKNSLRIIDDAIELHVRKEAVIHAFQGVDYVNQRELEKAIAEYTTAIEIDDQFAGAYDNRGSAYHKKGMYDLAIADHTKAIEIDPEFAAAYNNRGGNYQKKKQYDLALADLTRAIDLDPEFASAYLNRGSVYDDKVLYSRAIVDYTMAIDIDKDLTAAFNNRGIAYSNNRQFKNAINDFNKAIEMDPMNPATYYNRAISYSNNNQYYRAIADYRRATEIDSEFAGAYDNMGFVYLVKLGEQKKGCREFKIACRLGKCGNYNIVQVRGLCPSLRASRPGDMQEERTVAAP